MVINCMDIAHGDVKAEISLLGRLVFDRYVDVLSDHHCLEASRSQSSFFFLLAVATASRRPTALGSFGRNRSRLVAVPVTGFAKPRCSMSLSWDA